MNKKIAPLIGASVVTLALSIAPVFADSSMGMSMMINSNLMVGSQGSDVSSLQTFLVTKGYLTIPAGVSMGYFGPMTKMALKKYQSEEGLPSTGFFGPMTRAKWSSSMGMMNSSDSMNGHMTGGMNSNSGSSGAMAGVMVGGAMMTPDKDIVQNAVNANNVTTVVAAVKAADLVSTLEGAGPFTVFAPDNAAFAKLPAGAVANLLLPANLAQLQDLLTYHVVAGRYTSADLTDGLVLKTVEGKSLVIGHTASGAITINGKATVETPDVISSNGVTFVIDSVLSPADAMGSAAGVQVGGALMTADKDIVQNALNASNVTTVVAAVKAAGLVATLEGTGPFTVFAPDNNAFAKLPDGTVASLLLPENKAKLTDILTYHVVAGRYTSSQLYDGQMLTTVEGKKLTIGKTAGGKISINGSAMVETPNVISSNGVTFVIDSVLMPSGN